MKKLHIKDFLWEWLFWVRCLDEVQLGKDDETGFYISGGYFCKKRHGHYGRHAISDGSLTWTDRHSQTWEGKRPRVKYHPFKNVRRGNFWKALKEDLLW